jgi:hypothetical protein
MATHKNLHASCIPYNGKPCFSLLRMKKTQDEIELTHGLGEKNELYLACLSFVKP